MAGERYFSTSHCPFCNRDTTQLFESSGHERDSSGDQQWCLECGGWYFYFGWHPGTVDDTILGFRREYAEKGDGV